jgi:phosphatidylglycerophosphatase A
MSKSQSDNLSFRRLFREGNRSQKLCVLLSSWFGVGLIPGAPGTYGTLATVPFIVGIGAFGRVGSLLFFALMVTVAVWSSDRTQTLLGKEDPAEVVIDEVSGFCLTMLLLPPSWLLLGIGFVLFRVFDIVKPYPIRRMEKFRGGFGIVADDLVAGLYAHLSLRIFLLFVS